MKRYICELGPGEDYPGGILTVINDYMNSPYLSKYNLKHIITVRKKHKALGFLYGLLTYTYFCLFKKVELGHIHMSERGSCTRAILIIYLSSLFNVPIIVHSHGSEIIEYYKGLEGFHKRAFDNAMNKAKKIIVLTPGWKGFWKKIVREDKLEVLPNFVQVPNISKKTYKQNNKLNILFLGYIGERKGTYDLINAVSYLVKKKHEFNINLKVAGNGEIEKCKRLINSLNLEPYIEVVGWADSNKKAQLLSKADLLILPSHFESFGIVALEAMANRLAVICGDKGYTKELVIDGYNGYIAKSGNPSDIANKIIKAKNNLQNLGQNGYITVQNNYTEKIIVEKLSKIYNEVREIE